MFNGTAYIIIAAIWYVMVGLLGARTVYRWRIKSGAHDNVNGYYEDPELGTFFAAVTTLVAWPLWGVVGLGWLALRFVTGNPPKSPVELKREREEMQAVIDQLEREVGMKVEADNDASYRRWLEGRLR